MRRGRLGGTARSEQGLVNSARGVDGIQLLSDARKIYQDWFGRGGDKSQYIVVISPWTDADAQADAEAGVQLTMPVVHDLSLSCQPCAADGAWPLSADR